MNEVRLPVEYFFDPSIGRPISNGFVYVGNIDTDPTIGANQKQVYAVQENGNTVPLSQPLQTGGGGCVLYDGSPVQLVVSGEYSIAVLDKNLVQVFYVARSLVGDNFKTFDNIANLKADTTLEAGDTCETVGYYNTLDRGGAKYLITQTAPSLLGTINHELDNGLYARFAGNELTPEIAGAVGDGVTDDTNAIVDTMKYLALELYSYGVTFDRGREYLFNGYIIDGKIYSEYVQVDVKSRFTQEEFDYHTKEYVDSNLFIWRLALRSGRESLPSNSRIFDKTQFDAAIALGTVKVTFIGTSITRGENAQAERLNNWVQMFLEDLKCKYPNVDIVFKNLGIDGRRLDQYIDPAFVGFAATPPDPELGWYYPATNDSWQDGTTAGKSWEDHAKDSTPDLLVINFGMNDGSSLDQEFSDNLQTAITNAQAWATPPSIMLVSEVSPNQDEISSYSTIRKFSKVTRYTAFKQSFPLLDAGRYQRYAEGGIDDTRCLFKRIDPAIGVSDWRWSFSAPTTQGINSVSKNDSTPSVVIKDGEYNAVRMTFTFTPNGVGGGFFVLVGTNNTTQQYNIDSLHVWRETDKIRVLTRPGFGPVSVTVPNNVSSGIPEEIDVRIQNNHVVVFIDNVKYIDYFAVDNGADGGVGIGISNGINTNIVCDIGFPYQLSSSLLDKRGLYGELIGGVDGDGGNGVNHPARLAYEYVWRPAIAEIIEQL